MYNEIQFITVSCGPHSNKKRGTGKPWWSDTLSNMWNDMCEAERIWLRCNDSLQKGQVKSDYVYTRKLFDREVQRSKRLYWYKFQCSILEEVNEDPNLFWKSIGKIGVGSSKNNRIPMQVVRDDGSISDDVEVVLNKWKHDFSSLLNANITDSTENESMPVLENTRYDPVLNGHITLFEVKKAIDSAKRGKACGIDSVPSEVLKNDTSVSFLHILFNVCFNKGIVPSMWSKSIINPIPKSSTTDRRDPLSYRGITLASSMYKLYSSILNTRLSSWSESNDKFVDE